MKKISAKDSISNEISENALLNVLTKNRKRWGLDLYQADQKTDLVGSMQRNHFQSLEIIDYLEGYVIPFLEGYECGEEKRELKRWVFQTRGKLEKMRRHSSDGRDLDQHFDINLDDIAD